MKLVKESKVLLDFKLKCHSGLSFGFFEVLKFENKIITDYLPVKEYDFYKKELFF